MLQKTLSLTLVMLLFTAVLGYAQLKNPKIEKVSADRISWFKNKFEDVDWITDGFESKVELDQRQTNEIRARLQKTHGNPTKTIKTLINRDDFIPAMAIQFEYWFMVNDSIPFMVLDLDGPFSLGLVYVGANEYSELMPELKQALSDEVMKLERSKLANYQDYYYSIDREKWYKVTYKNGSYSTEELSHRPIAVSG